MVELSSYDKMTGAGLYRGGGGGQQLKQFRAQFMKSKMSWLVKEVHFCCEYRDLSMCRVLSKNEILDSQAM